MKVISILNHKGGVGKTTLTINLASALAKKKYKILCIDMDVQNQLIRAFTKKHSVNHGIDDVLMKVIGINDTAIPATAEDVFIIPSGLRLKKVQQQLITEVRGDSRLDKAIQSTNKYDFIIIDNGPGHSLLTTNSLLASDYIIIPIVPEILPLQGIQLLEETLNEIADETERLTILGTVLTKYDKRNAVTKDVENLLRKRINLKVFDTVIRTNVRIAESPSQGIDVYQSYNTKGIQDFESFALEVIKRINNDK